MPTNNDLGAAKAALDNAGIAFTAVEKDLPQGQDPVLLVRSAYQDHLGNVRMALRHTGAKARELNKFIADPTHTLPPHAGLPRLIC